MKDRTLIYSIAASLIIFLGYIAHVQYFDTRDRVTAMYREKQITGARQAALGLEAFIMERVKSLEMLARAPAAKRGEKSLYRTEYEAVFNRVGGFRYIMFINKGGVAEIGYPHNFPCPSNQPPAIRKKFKAAFLEAERSRQLHVFSKNVLVDGKVYICLISPIFSTTDQFRGAVLGILNVEESLQATLKPILGDSLDYAWVLNEQGFLLYHPKHKDMLLKNITEPKPDCFACHQNFDLERNVILNRADFGIKRSIENEKQIIGFAKVFLQNTTWLVAVSSPFGKVTQSIRALFRNFFIIILFMSSTVMVVAIVISRMNSKRLAAQKESEYLRDSAKLIEQKKAAETRYRILVEQSPEPIFLITRHKFLMHNESFEKLFELEKADIKAHNFNIINLIEPRHVAYYKKQVEKFVRSKQPVLFLALGMRTKNDRQLEVEISIRRISYRRLIAYQGIIHDVTLQRQNERERRQREHLALIGEMAARIAHEIKNPLASIQTGIQLLETEVPENSDRKNYFMRLRAEIQRVDSILKGLLSYAREYELERKTVDIEKFVSNYEKIIQPTIEKNNLHLFVNVQPRLPGVSLDPYKIKQVLWNIFLNAVQASSAGKNIYFDISRNGTCVVLKIRDEGVGISEKDMAKIFMPFFSTRAQGTGLGLAISKKIVELHNGSLKIESEINLGTSVMIHLPEVAA